MSLGTNYKRVGRKDDLITRILISKVNEIGMEKAKEEVKELRKLNIDELIKILKSK